MKELPSLRDSTVTSLPPASFCTQPKAPIFPRRRLQGGHDAPGAAAAHPTPGFELSPGRHGRGVKGEPTAATPTSRPTQKGRCRRRVGTTNRGFPRARPAPPAQGAHRRHRIRRPEDRNQANPTRESRERENLSFRSGAEEEEPRRAATTARQDLAARAAEGSSPHLSRTPRAEGRRRLTNRAAARLPGPNASERSDEAPPPPSSAVAQAKPDDSLG